MQEPPPPRHQSRPAPPLPCRIQRRLTAGWNMQAQSPDGRTVVYVGRPSVWGSPFPVLCYGRDKALELYRTLIHGTVTPEMFPAGHAWMHRFKEDMSGGHPMEMAVSYLRGHHLCCWCGPSDACHADILIEIANG